MSISRLQEMRATRKSSTVGLAHSLPRPAPSVTSPRQPPLAASSLVRSSGDPIPDDGRTLPAGATGAVAFVHAAGEVHEVAFVTPLHAVATVMAPSLVQAA